MRASDSACSSDPLPTAPAHPPTHITPLRTTPSPGAPHIDTHSAHTGRDPSAPGPMPPVAAPLPPPPPPSSLFVAILSTCDEGPCASVEEVRRAATGRVPSRCGASARVGSSTADARQARLSAGRSYTCSFDCEFCLIWCAAALAVAQAKLRLVVIQVDHPQRCTRTASREGDWCEAGASGSGKA